YLSPRDYHRVHMPITGTLTETLYIPGELFSVNQITAENIPGLFARNERMVCLFDTELGRMAVVMVGAMIVAGIETVVTGKVKPSGRLELNQH
ncbi:phosphatidylserine decarboxylase, partial [Siminovitchia fortis]